MEVAGFTGTAGTIGSQFDQFDDGKGSPVPAPDASGSRNESIRHAVLKRLNSSPAYRSLFADVFSSVAAGGAIDFVLFGRAIAEFEFTLIFADAPVDHFARGEHAAMSVPEKKGALVFFGKGGCVAYHSVAGNSTRCLATSKCMCSGAQIAPEFGVGRAMSSSMGRAGMDFGLEQVTGNPADRAIRTSPLRRGPAAGIFTTGRHGWMTPFTITCTCSNRQETIIRSGSGQRSDASAWTDCPVWQ